METQTTSNTNLMEPIISFLPLTKKEIIFLGHAMRLYRSYDVSNNIRVKVERLKDDVNYKYTPEFIIKSVCEICNITLDDLRSKKRDWDIGDPRACCSVLLKDYHPRMSYTRIGLYLRRDHSTILSHFEKVREVKEIKELYEKLKYQISKQ